MPLFHCTPSTLLVSLSFFLSQIDDFLPVELSSGTLGGEERLRERREAREHKSTRGNGMVQQEGRNCSEIEGGLEARHRRKGGNNGDCRSFRIARKLQTTSMHPPSFLYLQRSPPGETIAGSRYSCRQPRRIPTLLLFLRGSGRSFDLPAKL